MVLCHQILSVVSSALLPRCLGASVLYRISIFIFIFSIFLSSTNILPTTPETNSTFLFFNAAPALCGRECEPDPSSDASLAPPANSHLYLLVFLLRRKGVGFQLRERFPDPVDLIATPHVPAAVRQAVGVEGFCCPLTQLKSCSCRDGAPEAAPGISLRFPNVDLNRKGV
jgi:hypothetical protein